MADQPSESSANSLKIPYRHLGTGGALVAAILVLSPVKKFFYTREEGESDRTRIEKLERTTDDFNKRLMDIPTRAELVEALNKSTDRIIQSQGEADKRTNSRMDLLEQTFSRRLDLLIQERITTRGK